MTKFWRFFWIFSIIFLTFESFLVVRVFSSDFQIFRIFTGYLRRLFAGPQTSSFYIISYLLRRLHQEASVQLLESQSLASLRSS